MMKHQLSPCMGIIRHIFCRAGSRAHYVQAPLEDGRAQAIADPKDAAESAGGTLRTRLAFRTGWTGWSFKTASERQAGCERNCCHDTHKSSPPPMICLRSSRFGGQVKLKLGQSKNQIRTASPAALRSSASLSLRRWLRVSNSVCLLTQRRRPHSLASGINYTLKIPIAFETSECLPL
jgi:hypothetical protein